MDTACSYVLVTELAKITSVMALLTLAAQGRWGLTSWSFSIFIQVSASLLLSWKIWSTNSIASTNSSTHKLRNRSISVMWIVLESGAILATTTCVLLGLYVGKRNSGEIVIAALGQIDVGFVTSS